ncbi:MAG: peptide-N-glycosidase F-related protein [Bacteroidota bacterium]
MNKIAVFFILLLGAAGLKAAPGDTLRSRSHDKVVIKTDPSRGFTRYNGWAKFNGELTPTRKIYLDLQFECAPGLKCGEWDYINRILIGKRKGNKRDSLGWEISRFITPYGFYWDASQGWNFQWRIDLTEFAYLLRDSIEIIYEHTGYEANNDRGWRITLDFTSIEGTPEREALNMRRLLQVNAPYGNDSLFSARVPEMRFTPVDGTKSTVFSIIQTGHGMDKTQNCAEFCAKLRSLVLDGKEIHKGYVWDTECGSNPLFPQAGTWLYDRAGWCPGAPVKLFQTEASISAQREMAFNLNMESYTASAGGGGNYSITVFETDYANRTLAHDAAVTNILAPNTAKEYGRINPICGEPIVVIRNMGSELLRSLEIAYGTRGNTKAVYNWTGNLAPGYSDTVYLPRFFDWGVNPRIFEVAATKPNGQNDAFPHDNTAWSNIAWPSVYPDRLIVHFKTNNAPTENSWRILDANNNVLRSRDGFTKPQTIYRDTIQLFNGCFTFIFDDRGTPPSSFPLNEDGLNWWANTEDGAGIIQLRNGYSGGLVQNFNLDFGTDIVRSFTVGFPLDAEAVQEEAGMQVFPNPAGELLQVQLLVPATRFRIMDLSGREVASFPAESRQHPVYSLQTEQLKPGAYVVLAETAQGTMARNFQKR